MNIKELQALALVGLTRKNLVLDLAGGQEYSLAVLDFMLSFHICQILQAKTMLEAHFYFLTVSHHALK